MILVLAPVALKAAIGTEFDLLELLAHDTGKRLDPWHPPKTGILL